MSVTVVGSLNVWTAALAAAPTEGRPGVIGAAIGDGSLVGWLAEAGPAAAEGWLVANRKLVGAQVADLLRRRLQEAEERRARDVENASRLDRTIAQATAQILVGETLGRPDLPRLEVPPGWVLEDSGRLLQRVETQDGEVRDLFVSHRPIVTTGVLVDVESGLRWLVVEWPGEREGDPWGQAIISAADTQDPRAFVALRNLGAPVAGRNARELAKWLDDLESWNADSLPRAHQTTRLGWQGPEGRLGFLWGRTLITPNAEVDCGLPPALWGRDHVRLGIAPGDGRGQLADGLTCRGSLDGWRKAVDPILDYPRVLLGIYASLAACLLGLVQAAPNAVVDWSGPTSRGKTTTLRVAVSCWGPGEMSGGALRSWDVSPSALEQFAEMVTHMPLGLDDTKRATTRGDGSIVSAMLYQIVAGQGRGRARPDGMRRTSTWRCLLLSTGEAPATSWTQDAGARARVLSVRGSPFPDGVGKMIGELEAGLRENYGHAGPALVRWLLRQPTDPRPWLREAYEKSKARWTELAGGGAVGGRLAQSLALLELGAWAAHKVVGLRQPTVDPLVEVALPAAIAGAADADRAAAALRAAYTWAAAHPADFWGRHVCERDGEPRQPPRGWAGAWASGDWDSIAFVPECLARVLRHEGGFALEDVLPWWAERGWLVVDGKHVRPKRQIGREKVRCVVIKRSALDSVDGEGS